MDASTDMPEPECWFDDPDIEDQDSVLMQREDGRFECGVGFRVGNCEVIMTHAELQAALAYVEADRQGHLALGHDVV